MLFKRCSLILTDTNYFLTLTELYSKINMHFRKIVALVLREFVARTVGTNPRSVSKEEYERFLKTINCRSHAVIKIFNILFGHPPKSKAVREFVECWIRNYRILVGVRHYLVNDPNAKII